MLFRSTSKRVSVIASGGISHDLSTPRMGMINEAFDRQFIEHLRSGHAAQAIDHATRQVHLAGNGAEEVRMWLMAMGMTQTLVAAGRVTHAVQGHAPFELDFYQAMHDWFTGIGLGHWALERS